LTIRSERTAAMADSVRMYRMTSPRSHTNEHAAQKAHVEAGANGAHGDVVPKIAR
jgi:hypothetical protein